MSYTGIPPEGLFLLEQNRFEDSKEFYEAHKAELKRLVLTPFAQIAEALAADFYALDGELQLNPARMISRIRRDTRYTKEKHLYRSNVWMMFMRPKGDEPQSFPCMWFEVEPEKGWTAGVCAYHQSPAFMQFLRGRILEDPHGFLAAVGDAQKAGAVLEAEPYKKARTPDAPEDLKPYLNAKSFWLIYTSEDWAPLQTESILTALREIYKAYAPLYRWLMAAAQAWISL